jgi:hypothetical protein
MSQPSAAPAPAPAPAASAESDGEDEEGGKKSPRRRQKGGFRETLWFKKGEEAKEEAAVKADDLMKVEKGTGTISDTEKSLEDRYRDGAEDLSVDDRRKFSVRTGQTGVFQAVRVEDLKAAEQKREMAETQAAEKRKKNSLVIGIIFIILIGGAIAGGIFGANKFLYKPIISADAFQKMEDLFKAVKPAPKPQFAIVDKAASELIAEGLKAVDAMKLVPPGPEGDGTSAAELIMSAQKKDDAASAEGLKQLKDHFLRTALSRDYLASRTKELDLLIRLADRLTALNPENPNPVAMKFKELVLTLKKLKKEEVPAEIVQVLPHYPQPKFCVVPEDNEEKPLFEKFKAFVNEKRIFEPNGEKLCAVTTLLKLKAVTATVKKPDKAIAKALPGLEKQMNDELAAQLDAARLQLSYATITAPASGVVSRKSVETGQLVQPGQPLMALVESPDFWVVANFKETQLKRVRVGQEANFEVDAYPGLELRGRVESIAAATGAKFALLPPDNATGNFTKIVQRVPVKFTLTSPPDTTRPLRAGMSVKAVVTLD